MFAILVFYALMAGVYTFGKQVTAYASPFFLTGIRITFGGLCFLGYQFFKDRNNFLIKKEWIPGLATYGFFVFIMDSCRMLALQHIPSSNAAIIATTAPFIAAVMCWWKFNEKITSKKIWALVVGVAGVMPLLVTHLTAPHDSVLHIVLSYAGILASTFGFVIAGMVAKILINQKGAPFFMVVGTVMTMGGTIGFIMSALFEEWAPMPVSDWHAALPLIVYLIITHSLLAYPLYSYLSQKYPITLIAFAQLTTPFFTAILSYFFFDEPITLLFFISLAILTGALLLFYHEEKEEGLIEDNPNIS